MARCWFCGLVCDGKEKPTAQEVAKGYTSCSGCWAAFKQTLASGAPPEQAEAAARKVHHEAEMARWDALQAKGRAALEAAAKDNLNALVAEARK